MAGFLVQVENIDLQHIFVSCLVLQIPFCFMRTEDSGSALKVLAE